MIDVQMHKDFFRIHFPEINQTIDVPAAEAEAMATNIQNLLAFQPPRPVVSSTETDEIQMLRSALENSDNAIKSYEAQLHKLTTRNSHLEEYNKTMITAIRLMGKLA